MRGLRKVLPVLLALAAAGLAAGAAEPQWNWQLPPAHYKEMSMFERSQYDKAADLLARNSYRAAATEFEKFQAQFPNAKQVPHVLLLRAYCLHLNKNRGEAIKLYNEVMDYFGSDVSVAAPALYFQGLAQMENGETRAALKLWRELAEDADYAQHPLAAGALRGLGDDTWRGKDRAKALGYWQKATAEVFWRHNREEAAKALDSAIAAYVLAKDYAGYESWRVPAAKAADTQLRYWVVENAWNVAWNGFGGDFGGEYPPARQKEKTEAMRAFWTWFQTQGQWYEKNDKRNGAWSFRERSLRFLWLRLEDKEARRKPTDDAIAAAKQLPDKAEANARLSWLCDLLRDAQALEEGLLIADQIADRPWAEYKKYEAYAARRSWEKALARLVDIDGMNDAKWKERALNARAFTCREMGRYDEAIKLFQLLNRPPETLWHIQDCYRRWGKLDEALRQLTEIENSFPDQAPRAAWQKASYLDDSGNKEKAIAQARRIMRAYPKSDASSRAHQLLEKYGVKTGGGVADTEGAE